MSAVCGFPHSAPPPPHAIPAQWPVVETGPTPTVGCEVTVGPDGGVAEVPAPLPPVGPDPATPEAPHEFAQRTAVINLGVDLRLFSLRDPERTRARYGGTRAGCLCPMWLRSRRPAAGWWDVCVE